MKSGIYKITNLVNGKVYIGQSVNVNTRFGKHKSYLRNNTHHNDHLQRAFNKYGEENFSFEILEFVDLEKMDEREIFYIAEYDSMNIEKGYNLESGGNAQKIISESARQKKMGKNNPMYGKRLTKEERIKKSISTRGQNSKLDEEKVIEIKELLIEGVLSQPKIAKMFGVGFSTISKIATFKNWGYVRPDLNEKIVKANEERKKKKDETILYLHKKGYPVCAINKETGFDSRYISRLIKTIPSQAN